VDIVGVVGDVDDVGGTGITTDVADETVWKDKAGKVQAPGPSENRGIARAGTFHAEVRAREWAFPLRGEPDIKAGGRAPSFLTTHRPRV
jgi:hypothetical protein